MCVACLVASRLSYDPVGVKVVFYFVLVSPSPGGPWEGPDFHFLVTIAGFRPIPARIHGETYFSILFWP